MSYRICYNDPYGDIAGYTKSGLRYSVTYATKREALAALTRYMRPTTDKPYPCAWLSEDPSPQFFEL